MKKANPLAEEYLFEKNGTTIKRSLEMLEKIVAEMYEGNFSFAILLVGILQLCIMIKRR